jgi:diacylglycerol diphosphate phosphatase/phosphatidate phosphatase
MPSGVSSVGISGCFAGLGYLSLYLAGKLSLFDRRGYSSRVFFVLVPHLVSVLIAISRVNDYQHRWVDVLGAAVIGKDFSLSILKKCI